ncbi:large ribosomal subunit protein uL3m [Trichomonascus vanleenenianus]|uniref:mitochondrial 54S ribosomal protein uL3m MRPL9 n=1 Tax=Trichomonascus vanleenenianus TaxID=2268995 RepID=UPI003EC97AF7
MFPQIGGRILAKPSLMPLMFTRGAARLTALSVATTMPSKQPVLYDSAQAAHKRRHLRLRPGLIAVKRGMVPMFDENGERVPCTVLEVDRVQVTNVKTKAQNGYYAVEVGYGSKHFKNVTRPMLGHFSRASVAPKSKVVEFQVRDQRGLLPLGYELKADHFMVGQYVDVKSKTKGKGFAGVMKRWNFKGGNATHGASKSHRKPGSTGANQTPGRVLPGKKLPGHMGVRNNTSWNCRVMHHDVKKGILVVSGHVSGAKKSYVKVVDAMKKPLPLDLFVQKGLNFTESKYYQSLQR